MFHYFQNLSSFDDDQHFDDLYHSHNYNMLWKSSIADYDLGCEWDLFKVPEPEIEQPLVNLDHMTSATSMILCGQDIISQEIKFSDTELIQNEDLMNNLFYEYKDLLENEPSSPSQNSVVKEDLYPTGRITKSVSSDSLISADGAKVRPSSVNFTEMGMENVHGGMRRVLSEGYINPPFKIDHTTETRLHKLSRYRDKKSKRNFHRKIKYARRKVLADGQPRIKGRFAKTEETGFFRL